MECRWVCKEPSSLAFVLQGQPQAFLTRDGAPAAACRSRDMRPVFEHQTYACVLLFKCCNSIVENMESIVTGFNAKTSVEEAPASTGSMSAGYLLGIYCVSTVYLLFIYCVSTGYLLCLRLPLRSQAAPRDALISDLAPPESRSACFGFAQSMRKWGSFVGAGLSFVLMKVCLR
jgi:hypothetical protein